MGALAGAGVSDAIVYGLYPAAVPLIAAGVAWAAHHGGTGKPARLRHRASQSPPSALRPCSRDQPGRGQSQALGLFLALLGTAAVIARRQRA